ncbi:AMP-binding protein [Streptomyces sp. NPDC057445]|uniref:AMP-binding protein n=1 Tax=Streptomyces sp. NPDC057445 TaxID=3346136 RepID=UPI0036CA831F
MASARVTGWPRSCPTCRTFPVAHYGILRAGGVVVPTNPLLMAREIAFTLRDSGPGRC